MSLAAPDDTFVTLAVLGAAFLHAAWHALLKTSGDQLSVIATVYTSASVLCLALLPLVALPAAPAWGYVAASVALHCGSYVYIARCYELSHLSSAFPLFRGMAPLLVGAGAWAFAGETLAPLALAGMLLAVAGIMSLAFEGGVPWRAGGPPLVQLTLSALFVAGYTVVDGLGARAAGDALGYIAWLFALNGPAVLLIAGLTRRQRLADTVRRQWRRCALAGVVAIVAHGVVIWAMTVGAIATVAALRETSVVFAAILGATLLREPLGRTRITAAALVAAGIALLHHAS